MYLGRLKNYIYTNRNYENLPLGKMAHGGESHPASQTNYIFRSDPLKISNISVLLFLHRVGKQKKVAIVKKKRQG